MPTRIGTVEILILAIIVLVFFGTKKLPDFIKYFGIAIKEFKKSLKGED